MPVPPYQVMSLLLLVFPAAALAQPAGHEAEVPTRQLELSLSPRPELWVAPGQPSLVLLDAPLAVDTMPHSCPRVKKHRRWLARLASSAILGASPCPPVSPCAALLVVRPL